MKKVITYGTFDLFHQGHYNMLKRAKEYGDYLIVGVTGENYDIERGKLSVKEPLAQRIENVRKTGLADQIIVEEYLGQKIDDIIKYGVDVFVIGNDWKGKFDHLSRYCKLVYLERTKGISSTQIREENFRHYNIGIITDSDDNQLISEAAKVDGFSVTGMYSDDGDVREDYAEDTELTVYGKAEDLIEDSDIVYVRSRIETRAEYITEALKAGKHVIYDPPAVLSLDQQKKLYKLAQKNHVIYMSNVKMVHIHVFNQLLWMTQGGLIGDILSFNCSISRMDRSIGNLFYNMLVSALCPMIKILGKDYKSEDIKTVSDEDGIQFATLNFNYDKARAVINVGDKIRVRNQLEIIGTKGTIRVDGNWWRGSFFKLDTPDSDVEEIYNTNYQGNGFKYLIRAMATMMENERYEAMGLFEDEDLKITEILEKVSNHK